MQSKLSIPGPPGQFLLGNVKAFKSDSLGCLISWHRQYGDLLQFKLGLRNVYLFSHPDYIEQTLIKHPEIFTKMYDPGNPKGLAHILGQGLVTSQGELWRKQRRLMQPVFQRNHTQSLIPQIQLAGMQMINRWQQLPNDAIVNIADEMMKLTLEVITQTMFSTSVLNQINEIAPALDIGIRYAAKTAMNPLTPPLSWPTPGNRQFLQARNQLNQVIDEVINQRRNAGAGQNDLLDRLINAQDPVTGSRMDDRQIRDEVTTIFSAGHETTANALTWTLYLLGRHPEVLSQARKEIADIDTSIDISPESIPQLVYCRAVLEESMRIRPPVGFMMRKIKSSIDISNYPIKAPGLAVFSIYNLHHHPEFWDQPEQFKPERFIDNKTIEKYSYLPFGSGERYCIGKQFAMTEALVLLTLILKHFQLTPIDDNEPKMEMAVTIRPKGGLNMRMQQI